MVPVTSSRRMRPLHPSPAVIPCRDLSILCIQVDGARPLTVYFVAETSASMPWKFTPQQKFVKVVPGETALAFYTAHNPTGGCKSTIGDPFFQPSAACDLRGLSGRVSQRAA